MAEDAERERPNVIDLASRMVSSVAKEPAAFLLAGLPPTIVALVFGVGSVAVLYGGIIAGMMPGVLSDDPDEAALLGMGIGFGGFVPVLLVAMIATVPMSASLHRAVWAHVVRGETLSFGSALATWNQDLGRVLLYNVAYGLAVIAGMMLCYLPGLVVTGLMVFAGPAIYVHRLSIGEAVALSLKSAQDEPGWHLGFFGLSFVILIVLQYVPILGIMLIYTAYPLYVLLAYRALFGDGERPTAT